MVIGTGFLATRLKYLHYPLVRMAKHFPLQNRDVIKLLSQLGDIRAEYPPELLTSRRKAYLNLAAQLAATGMAVSAGGSEVVSVPVHEPMSIAMKFVLGALVTVIIALSTYLVTIINDNRDRLMELLSGATASSEKSPAAEQFREPSTTPLSTPSETATPIYTITPTYIDPQNTSEPNMSAATSVISTVAPEKTDPGKHLGQTETPPGKR